MNQPPQPATPDLPRDLDGFRIEVDHESVSSASAGQAVGVHVSQRVREGDTVSKVT